jgi:hypothetical protein
MSEEKFHTNTSVWNDNLEEQIKKIMISCHKHKTVNMSAAYSCSTKHDILMYSTIVLSPLSGILVNLGSTTLAVTIISFIAGLLSAIAKFGKFEQKCTLYKNTAAKYASLEGNISRQLALNVNDRVNAGKYLEWVSTSYEELFGSSPLLPEQDKTQVSLNNDKEVKKNVPEVQIELNKFTDGKMKYELERLFGQK